MYLTRMCKLKLTDCTGHFRHIRFALSFFHNVYLKHTLNLLQYICKACSCVLSVHYDLKALLKKMCNLHTEGK